MQIQDQITITKRKQLTQKKNEKNGQGPKKFFQVPTNVEPEVRI